MNTERIENLKKMYRKYKLMGAIVSANRVLARLRELGVDEDDIRKLRMED